MLHAHFRISKNKSLETQNLTLDAFFTLHAHFRTSYSGDGDDELWPVLFGSFLPNRKTIKKKNNFARGEGVLGVKSCYFSLFPNRHPWCSVINQFQLLVFLSCRTIAFGCCRQDQGNGYNLASLKMQAQLQADSC